MDKASETVFEKIERESREYRLKHYGTLDVDMWGRKLLTSDEILQIRRTKNLPTPKALPKTHEQIEGAQWRFV